MKETSIATVEELTYVIKCYINDIYSILKNPSKYIYFSQKKTNEKKRTFCKPHGIFRVIQDNLNKSLLQKIAMPNIIRGGVLGCSIIENAALHRNQDVVFATDLKDYFPSINSNKVRKTFIGLGMPEEVAEIITGLTTFHGRVPLGFPTSVTIANLTACSMAKRFVGLCKANGFNCSIWVDDIVFSGSNKLRNFIPLIKKIILQEGYIIKEEKTRVMDRHGRQVVTKLTVNSGVNVSKSKKREVRSLIYRCRKLGLESQVKTDLETLKRSTNGKIKYISSVNKIAGEKLLQDYNKIAW